MILSMTGFGRSHKVFGEFSITVEVKSVNHRFHECYVRMPRQLVKLEDKLKRLVQSYIKRGKVDLFVTIEGSPLVKQKVEVNLELAKEYRNAYQKLSSELGLQHTIDLSHFLIKEDIIMISEMEENTEIIEEAILGTTAEALKALLVMRENEGFGLRTEFERYLTDIEQILPSIAAVVPEVLQTYTDRLKRKILEHTNGTLDELRVMTEIGIIADKSDISEEVSRLTSHIEQFRSSLNENGPVGRKLDFLLQEMNREVNTIGSKSTDSRISSNVVELKTILEKMREQAQNVQ